MILKKIISSIQKNDRKVERKCISKNVGMYLCNSIAKGVCRMMMCVRFLPFLLIDKYK